MMGVVLIVVLIIKVSYFCSLKYINVAMVTVLKNVTNVITAVGEMYLFNKHHDNRVWAALFLMVRLVATKHDAAFIFFIFSLEDFASNIF